MSHGNDINSQLANGILKVCNTCNEWHPPFMYYDKRDNKCRTCKGHARRERVYGLTVKQYTALVESQQGECAVCGLTTRELVVDHNHTTGKVRGLLCSQCNTALGLLQDDVDIVRRAEGYLIHG